MGRSKAVLFAPAKSSTVPFPREVSRRPGSVNKWVDSLNNATQALYLYTYRRSANSGLHLDDFFDPLCRLPIPRWTRDHKVRSIAARGYRTQHVGMSPHVKDTEPIVAIFLNLGEGHDNWLIAHIDADEGVKRIGVYTLDGGFDIWRDKK